MNLLIVEYRDWLNPRAGGAERALYEISRRLIQRGWGIDYLCSAPGPNEDLEIEGIRVLRRGRELLFGPTAVRTLHGELRDRRYDLVVEGIDKLPFFFPWLAPRRRVAGLIPHLLGATARDATGFLPGLAINLGEALLPFCYRRAPLIAISESTRTELIARGFRPGQVEVVLYGLDPAHHTPGPETEIEPALFLYVGRLRRYKSLDMAIRAFARVAAEIPEARFVIAGTGDDRPRLEELTRTLGVAAAVEFIGFVSEAEKVRLMRRARALVYPSRKEGWGLPVIEANACGTPAVASRVDGLRDAVRDGETGVLVPYGDQEAMAAALLRMIRDDAWRAHLRAGALAWAERFRWDATTDRMEAVLKRAAGMA